MVNKTPAKDDRKKGHYAAKKRAKEKGCNEKAMVLMQNKYKIVFN